MDFGLVKKSYQGDQSSLFSNFMVLTVYFISQAHKNITK